MVNLLKKPEISLTIILIFFVFSANAQTIVGDGRGQSAIIVTPKLDNSKKGDAKSDKKETKDIVKKDTINFGLGMITLSTSDKKIGFNYFHYFHNKLKPDFYVGISANGKAKNSISNIFSSGNFIPEGSANLNLGLRLTKPYTFGGTDEIFEEMDSIHEIKKDAYGDSIKTSTNKIDSLKFENKRKLYLEEYKRDRQDILDNYTKPANDLWIVFNSKINGTSFKRFIPDSSFNDQINKVKFLGYSVNLGFNYWNARIKESTVMTGVTVGISQKNNFSDLIENVREDTRLEIDSSSNSTRSITLKETVYTGTYKESLIFPLNMDVYIAPHKFNNVGFLMFMRNEISMEKEPQTQIGGGIFFMKNENIFNPSFGISLGYKDVFNNDKSDDLKGNSNKIVISIGARFDFTGRRLFKN